MLAEQAASSAFASVLQSAAVDIVCQALKLCVLLAHSSATVAVADMNLAGAQETAAMLSKMGAKG